jgi:hypothetical protein
MVLSFRPNLNYTTAVVMNATYNYDHDLMAASKPKVNKIRRVEGGPRSRRQMIEPKPEVSLELQNYYESLQLLIDDCNEFNGKTDSSISVGSCVKQITRITERKEVEKINLDQILKEHRDLLDTRPRDLTPEEKGLLSSGFVHNAIKNKVNTSIQTDVDDGRLILEQQALDVSKRANKITKSFKMRFSIGLAPIIQHMRRLSDEVNPDRIAKIAGMISPMMLDPTMKAAFNECVFPLITMANKASQALIEFPKELLAELSNTMDKLKETYADLD